MANSIYLGGGIKSAFCGGNVKEIWQGSNKLWGEINKIHIIENDYPFVKIGSRLWLAENLYENIGGGIYNSRSDKELYGRYYNYTDFLRAVSGMLPSGWLIPDLYDAQSLNECAEGNGFKLTIDGTNNFGFNGLRAGGFSQAGYFIHFENYCEFWTRHINKTYSHCRDAFSINLNGAISFEGNDWNANSGASRLPIRLCKKVINYDEATSPIKIGDGTYNTKRIGNLEWITENLHENFAKFKQSNGIYYYEPYSSFSLISSALPSGWRIPTKEDWNDVYSSAEKNILNMVSISSGGTNKCGLNLEGYGWYKQDTKYETSAMWWSNTDSSSTTKNDLLLIVDSNKNITGVKGTFLEDETTKTDRYAMVRVCRTIV